MINVDIKKTSVGLNFNFKIYYNNTFLDFSNNITGDSGGDIFKGLIYFSIDNHTFEYQIPNFTETTSMGNTSLPMFGVVNEKDFYFMCLVRDSNSSQDYIVYAKFDLSNYTSYINSYKVNISRNFTSFYFDIIEIDNIEYVVVIGALNLSSGDTATTAFMGFILNETRLLPTFQGAVNKDCSILKIDYNKKILFLYDKVNKTLLSYNYNNKTYINQDISSSIFQGFVNNILNPNFSDLACISNKIKDNKFYFLFSNKVVVFTIIDENNVSNYEETDFQLDGTLYMSGATSNYTNYFQQYSFGSAMVTMENDDIIQNAVLIQDEVNSNYNITLKFDNDVIKTYTKTADTILKAVRISLLGGSITANLTYSKGDNDSISTLEYPNSYKYATSVTIGENTYNITDNVVEVSDLNISGDVEIKLNNGVIAYYDITFKNDTKLLQIKRTEENTLPVYEGETPTQEGKVFVGWTPEIYPVDKAQIYQATFEQAPFTITIADSGSNSFSVLWLDTQSTEKAREFSKPITLIRINHLVEPYSHMVSLILGYGDSESSVCLITYEKNNVIPQNFKIGDSTYDFGTDYSVNIDSNTTITIVANTRYFIRFLNYDDSVLETKYVYSGVTPTYTGDTPYQKGYDFTGWTPDLYPADKKQDYKAKFTIQTFTIRFLNDDGSVLETKSVNYGETPTYTGTIPTKEGYTFNGWSPTLYPANKNQDYTATYRNSAFALTLYKNSAENNRIDKTEYLTSVGEITGYLRNETNIINPSIVIEYTGVIDFNYVYISTFNRYYFVTNITSVRTNLWRLDMSCDVLMTYKETILNYECYVSRNENDYNPDIEDTYLPLEYEKVVEVTNLYNDTYDWGKIFLEGNYSVVFTTIYKGTEYEVIDEQIETEFQDLEGNILEVSSISLGASNYKCIGIIRNNILDNLNKLVEKTINDDTLASYIISLIVFPIKGSDLSFSTLNPSKLLIKDDSTSITVAQDDVSYPRGGVLTPVIANQFTIKPKYNNFLDYEPYTTYEIYLPFYGWLKLNSYQILNQQLVVNYVPQVDSEQCTIIISKGASIGGSREVIAEVTCQLGIQIPINSTNVERVNREKTANTLNSIVGTISGVAVAGAGAVTGNPLAVVGGASMAIGSITSGLSKNMTMLPSAQSKTGSSYDGALGDRTFKLRITYPKIAVDDISKYAKYIGRPLQTNVKLNTLTGYTIVGGVHIENLDTATDNEKTDIENQLRKGVII